MGEYALIDLESAIGQVVLVQVIARVIDVCDSGVELVEIVVVSLGTVVTVLVLVIQSHHYMVLLVPFVFQGCAANPFFLIQIAEITHGFLAVELEEGESAVLVFAEHHLAAVRFLAAGLAVGASPGQFPLLAEVVESAELMILQSVDMGDVIAANQFVPLVVYAFPALIAVIGVAGEEERVANAVVFAKSHAQRSQGGHVQRAGILIVIEVALRIAAGFHGFIESVLYDGCPIAQAH